VRVQGDDVVDAIAAGILDDNTIIPEVEQFPADPRCDGRRQVAAPPSSRRC